MNTERTPYGAEDNESDDSAAVSFGSGPAFRPIPRIERPAPAPKPEKPQRVTVPEGLLFSRAQETIQASQAAAEKKDDDEDDTEDEASAQSAATATARPKPTAKPPAREPSELLRSTPLTAAAEGVIPDQQEARADQHIPDIGEFRATLPETPPVSEIQPPQPVAEHAAAEQRPALPPAENEPLTHTYPAETAADLPEWPEGPAETPDPPLQPKPPRTKPAASLYGQFEAPSSAVDTESDSNYAGTSATTGGAGHGAGGGGAGSGRPAGPPSGAAGGMPPGNLPPNNHNAYFGMSGYNANIGGGGGGTGAGHGGGGYNPDAAPRPNAQPRYEAIQNITQKKKGNIWPYVAVLAENIARKRADNKLKKEMGARMDQQEQAQEVSNTNQVRLERQQQEMLDEQRKQAIREAHRPSGNEWGVPRPAAGAGPIPGQRTPGERTPMPGVMGQPEQAVPMQTAEQQQMEQQAELAAQQQGRERHSAWHTYYEDENGRQIGGVEYGKGFKQEQKEIVRDHSGDSVVAGVAGAAGVAAHGATGGASGGGHGGGGGGASGGMAGQSGAYSGYGQTGYGQTSQQGYQPQQPTLPSGMTTPGLPAGTSRTDPQHQLPGHAKKSNLPGPLFWLMVGLIIFAFFAAALI